MGIGPTEWLVILCIVVLLFGANKIPQLAKSVGEGIREFRKTIKSASQEDEEESKSKKA